MAPLAVDPAALDSAGGAAVAAGAGLGAVISSLTAALAGCAGMAGDDPAGAVFGRSYDGSAAALVQAMSVARNGLCNLGDGVRMSAHNYSLAEAMSDVAGRAAPLPAPPPSGCVGVGAPPSAVGGGGGAPKGWGWVAPYIGMIWPNGDSTKLRAAAVAWRSAGTQFALTEIQSTAGHSTESGPHGRSLSAHGSEPTHDGASHGSGHGSGSEPPGLHAPHREQQLAMHSNEPAGEGWHRLSDEAVDPQYGEPLSRHWDFTDNPADRSRINPVVAQLMEDPNAPFGPATTSVPTYTAAQTAAAQRQLCDTYKLVAHAVPVDTNGSDKALARITLTNAAAILDNAAADPALDAKHRDAARASDRLPHNDRNGEWWHSS